MFNDKTMTHELTGPLKDHELKDEVIGAVIQTNDWLASSRQIPDDANRLKMVSIIICSKLNI